tara:strand:+ start:10571 stop:10987 length:417 start_codon:yes stop_codon:yes gene_type:complete
MDSLQDKEIIENKLKSKISNFNALSENKDFKEWKDIIFGVGLWGLDYIDVYNAVENKEMKIQKIKAAHLSDIVYLLKQQIQHDSSAVIIALKVYGSNPVNSISQIQESVISSLNDNAEVLIQGIENKTEEFEIILLND